VHLAVDSSGSQLVCALADAEGIITFVEYPTGSPESRDIGAVAGAVLGELLPGDLTSVIVGTGPGSFIGTRVAISYANGFAATGEVPLYGVNSLAAIGAVYGEGASVVLRDARRGEVYWQNPTKTQSCRLVSLNELLTELRTIGATSVVWEQPSSLQPVSHDISPDIASIAAQAGARLITCPGVPAEGLRRLGPLGTQPEYVEPVYLRGFT
jgi:tRNA threonylcarbamoyl adenosine modification protein YeaZ